MRMVSVNWMVICMIRIDRMFGSMCLIVMWKVFLLVVCVVSMNLCV